MNYWHIISNALPAIILILLGYGFRRLKIAEQSTINGVKKFLLTICLPALVFKIFFTLKVNSSFIIIPVALIFAWLLAYILGGIISKMVGGGRYFKFVLVSSETGLFGYALFSAIMGQSNLQYMAMCDLSQAFFVNLIVFPALISLRNGSSDFKSSLKNMVTSPIIWAIIAGLAFGALPISQKFFSTEIGNILIGLITTTGNTVVSLICIVVGFEINFAGGNIRKPLLAGFFRFLVLIPIGFIVTYFLVNKMLHADKMIQAAVMGMFLLPCNFVMPVFMHDDDIEGKAFINNSISITTLVSIPLFIVGMMFFS